MKKYFENMKKHNRDLSEFASNDMDAVRFTNIIEDFRTPYFRDVDKILYSLSYFRYIDKTQVFSFEDNDMISKRMTHIQLVSKIARTIGRGLNLNEDLIEAASLGHDLGHVPFGHVGERFLNELSIKYGEGYFNHNVQSVRTLMNVENGGNGSNVTLQVLDAILCHNGEELKQVYSPTKKTADDFIKEYNDCYTSKSILNNLTPMTLEGCVVRISDVIAYIGRDIEDALRIKKINIDDLPLKIREIFGVRNSDIINRIITDILENSIDKNYIKMSDEVYQSMKELMSFNYANIYLKANSKEQLNNIKNKFERLFELYYNQIETNSNDDDIYRVFLNEMSDEYNKNTSSARKVIDFIAGMTDSYFIKQYDHYFGENN